MDFSQIDFSRLSSGELVGMIGGVVGVLLAGGFIIWRWLQKMS